MRARDLLGPDGPLARHVEGYEHREGQQRMAEAVQRALDDDGVLLVEAGTGTGKTLAYLVPAILSGRRVIVSTGTKTLQDQIMEHDLPLLERTLALPVSAVCMKGLGNYLCLRRYHEFASSAEADRAPYAQELLTLRKWKERTESGDRAELAALAEDASIWPHVLSGSDTRIGAGCAHFEPCFVTKMRRAAEKAQIVVVNHHLFFADLATRGPHGGGVLPDYDAVIFDEAHQIEDVATEFFGVRVSSQRVEKLASDASRAFAACGVDDDSHRLTNGVLETGARFFAELPRLGADGSRAPLAPDALGKSARDAMLALDTALEALALFARRHASAGEAVATITKRAQQLRDDVAQLADAGRATGARGAFVTWIEPRGRGVSIGASPVDASAIVREEVLARTRAVVFTSATLATERSFAFVKERLGIGAEVDELIVDSPFDYPKQAALYVPPDLPDPRDPAFLLRASDEIARLVAITGGGAFILCTSTRAMQELAKRTTPKLPHGVPVFVQGSAPKPALLERFRESGHAVLFATASFWEGVDVPGDALRLVVIDKLPFDVPTDPLVVARTERLRERGENAFTAYTVPSAALALKQGFGRLIRTRKDRGIVAVLDARLRTKSYGRVFLRSLPDATRCDDLDAVARFFGAPHRAEKVA